MIKEIINEVKNKKAIIKDKKSLKELIRAYLKLDEKPDFVSLWKGKIEVGYYFTRNPKVVKRISFGPFINFLKRNDINVREIEAENDEERNILTHL